MGVRETHQTRWGGFTRTRGPLGERGDPLHTLRPRQGNGVGDLGSGPLGPLSCRPGTQVVGGRLDGQTQPTGLGQTPVDPVPGVCLL